MHSKFRFTAFFCLILALLSFCGFSEDFKGKDLSDQVYTELLRSGISSTRMQLCRTDENNYPYNIIIQIKQTQGFSTQQERQYSNLLFIFPQENALKNPDFIKEFIKWNQQTDFDFNVTVLLTACDKSEISGNDRMTGTEVYADLIQGTESYCAVYTNLDAQKLTTLTPGSGKNVCPLWLVRLTDTCFEEQDLKPAIKGSLYLSLYKLNILQSSRTLTSLLSRNIPAVEVNVKESQADTETLLSIYENLVTSFSNLEDFKDDTHYIPLRIFTKRYWISEKITIRILLILITLSLISICDLGFIFRKGHSKKALEAKRALKTLYLLPGTIFVLTLCLILAQLFATLLYNSFLKNPVAVLGIKLIIAFILISFAYLIELRFHKKAGYFAYEYLLSISSLLNVFIFSAIDISLFYLFAIIYILIEISRFFKKTIALYIFFIISFLPYLQLIFAIVSYSSPSQIMPLIFASPLYNIILSCAITPLSILLLRIYLALTKTKKEGAQIQTSIKKKFPKYYILIQSLTVAVFAGIIIFATKYIQRQFVQKYEISQISGRVIESPQTFFLNAKYQDSNYYGGTIRKIAVNTNVKATRVEIFVSGQSENPIYYTTYTFSPSGKQNQVQFNLPDFPPESLTVTYTPDNSAISAVDVYAYYDISLYPEGFITNDSASRRKTFVKEKTTLLISAGLSGDQWNGN